MRAKTRVVRALLRAVASMRSSNTTPGPLRSRYDVTRDRVLATGMAGAALAAVLLFASAARMYPGGTHFDHDAPGHDFFLNTLCDVARSTSLGGQPNATGASLARTAMTLYAIAIGFFYWLVPRNFPSRPRLGVSVRALGLASVPATIAVAMLPTDRFAAVHGIAIVVAAVPGIAAALLVVAGLVCELRHRRGRGEIVLALVGVATLVVAALDFILYVRELVFNGPPQVAVSVLERASTLLLLLWILVLAGKTLKASPPPAVRFGGGIV
jgi:hypothetical protein